LAHPGRGSAAENKMNNEQKEPVIPPRGRKKHHNVLRRHESKLLGHVAHWEKPPGSASKIKPGKMVEGGSGVKVGVDESQKKAQSEQVYGGRARKEIWDEDLVYCPKSDLKKVGRNNERLPNPLPTTGKEERNREQVPVKRQRRMCPSRKSKGEGRAPVAS